jgi:hypothetical protein
MKKPMGAEYSTKFIQIASGFHGEVYALDEVGNVWKLYKGTGKTSDDPKDWSRWGKITSYRMNPDSEGPE